MPTTDKRQIGYAEEDTGGYSWGLAAVYQDGDRFYIIQDSGCSCSGPSSNYSDTDAVVGPAATLGGLFDELYVDRDKHPTHVKEAFIGALETINEETLAATRAALGLPKE